MITDVAWALLFGLVIGVLMGLTGSDLAGAIGLGAAAAVVWLAADAFRRRRRPRPRRSCSA